jgi:hypothetical protein
MMMVKVLVAEKVKPRPRFGIVQLVDDRWGVIDRESGDDLVEGAEYQWKILAVGTAGRLNKALREGRLSVMSAEGDSE